MNPMPPVICGTMVAAMMAAGVSHYWSVESFVANYPTTPAVRILPTNTVFPSNIAPKKQLGTSQNSAELTSAPTRPQDANSKEFFENLIQELRNLRNENRDLTNQIAETNRDLMKMQFQIDTYSESFRPLPTSQDRDDTTYEFDYEDLPGVLPPRAEPVYELEE